MNNDSQQSILLPLEHGFSNFSVSYQKQIQQALQKCDSLIEKGKHRYLMNIRPTAPKLNAYIKTHKEDQPIRPVINNMQAPSYKAAKFLNPLAY